MKNKIIAIVHAGLLLFSLSSPLWIDWKIVLVGFVLYELQKIIFKGCLLSFAQFGAKDGKPIQHFTPYYLAKIFHIKAEESVVMRNLDYILAPSIPLLAIVLQLLLKLNPWVKI